jgi:hypothetical protein
MGYGSPRRLRRALVSALIAFCALAPGSARQLKITAGPFTLPR